MPSKYKYEEAELMRHFVTIANRHCHNRHRLIRMATLCRSSKLEDLSTPNTIVFREVRLFVLGGRQLVRMAHLRILDD